MRSSLISLKRELLTLEADVTGWILLPDSKTDQEAEGKVCALSTEMMG